MGILAPGLLIMFASIVMMLTFVSPEWTRAPEQPQCPQGEYRIDDSDPSRVEKPCILWQWEGKPLHGTK
jgi:hypothetical protein